MTEGLSNLFTFYGELGRPLSLLEIRYLLKNSDKPENLSALEQTLDKAVKTGTLSEEECFFSLKKFGLKAIDRKKQDLLLDKKWKKLSRLARWFRFLPFVDFVLASGSMALSNVTPTSDFDLLLGVREGRIFTARYSCLFLFTLLSARRNDDSEASSPDRLCFNHFVTAGTYAKPPINYYRLQLYKNLKPLWGNEKKMEKFFSANSWRGVDSGENSETSRYVPKKLSVAGKILEEFLGGKIGDIFENFLESLAKKRLKKYVAERGGHGRVVVNRSELEFHFELPYENRFRSLGV